MLRNLPHGTNNYLRWRKSVWRRLQSIVFEKRSASEEEEKSDQEAQEAAAREISDAAVGRFEALGATNLLIQNDNFTSADGTKALKMSGSLDLMQDEQPLRCRFISIIFPFETSTVELKLIILKKTDMEPR